MASYITDSYANTILSNMFSGAYIGLSTTEPTKAGANITEPAAANGYARVAASAGSFSASGGTIKNTKYIYFPEAAAAWGTVTHLIVSGSSARSSGTDSSLRYVGELTASVAVGANTVPLFRPNALSVTITDS